MINILYTLIENIVLLLLKNYKKATTRVIFHNALSTLTITVVLNHNVVKCTKLFILVLILGQKKVIPTRTFSFLQ